VLSRPNRHLHKRIQVFELPTVLAYPLFYKLVVPEASLVSKAAMQAWIGRKGLVSLDLQSRMMEVLCKDGCSSVTQADLKSMMAGILLSHPGLEFLQDTPEFQDRWVLLEDSFPNTPALAACLEPASFTKICCCYRCCRCPCSVPAGMLRPSSTGFSTPWTDAGQAGCRCGISSGECPWRSTSGAPSCCVSSAPCSAHGVRRLDTGAACCARCSCWTKRRTSTRYWTFSPTSIST